MVIREARPDDLDAMSKVFVASISELCAADHAGDPAIIGRWTANKDPQSLMRWLDDPENHVFIVDDGGEIVGIGSYNRSQVQAVYVAPKARFAGVSKALLTHMEAAMRRGGVREATLMSTETAHRFYRSAGWRDCGAPQEIFGVANVYPMSKALA